MDTGLSSTQLSHAIFYILFYAILFFSRFFPPPQRGVFSSHTRWHSGDNDVHQYFTLTHLLWRSCVCWGNTWLRMNTAVRISAKCENEGFIGRMSTFLETDNQSLSGVKHHQSPHRAWGSRGELHNLLSNATKLLHIFILNCQYKFFIEVDFYPDKFF